MVIMDKVISLSSDFGVQNRGIAIMEAVALGICQDAKIFHLSHGIPSFGISQGARVLEAVMCLPVGCHVMIVDPGVGTERKGLIVETGRGDKLIGPDNGVLLPATRFLGGFKRAFQLSNEKYYRKPVSPVFHGRDVFAPAAAHICNGVKLEEFGPELKQDDLVKAPYDEAKIEGNRIIAQIIDVNNFGSSFLNVMQKAMHGIFKPGDMIMASLNGKKFDLPYRRTFGEVKVGEVLLVDDDFGRVEVAVNQGFFVDKFTAKVGDIFILEKH
jgi:S-adenosylmethionine hydrolase